MTGKMSEKDDPNKVISSYPFSEEETRNDENIFSCPDCQEEFDTKRGLNIHQGQQHTGE